MNSDDVLLRQALTRLIQRNEGGFAEKYNTAVDWFRRSATQICAALGDAKDMSQEAAAQSVLEVARNVMIRQAVSPETALERVVDTIVGTTPLIPSNRHPQFVKGKPTLQ